MFDKYIVTIIRIFKVLNLTYYKVDKHFKKLKTNFPFLSIFCCDYIFRVPIHSVDDSDNVIWIK